MRSTDEFVTGERRRECDDKYSNYDGPIGFKAAKKDGCEQSYVRIEKNKLITNSIDQVIDSLVVVDVENTKTVNALEVEKNALELEKNLLEVENQDLQAALSEA